MSDSPAVRMGRPDENGSQEWWRLYAIQCEEDARLLRWSMPNPELLHHLSKWFQDYEDDNKGRFDCGHHEHYSARVIRSWAIDIEKALAATADLDEPATGRSK